jgi:L-ribulose-5-phosphate 4-epimerase
MAHTEGYIKFNLDWNKKTMLSEQDIVELNSFRDLLYRQNLIGVFDKEIGFGNISCRIAGKGEFVITGSKTGLKKHLGCKDYSMVEKYNISANYILCSGDTEASSESLSHAAAYLANDEISAVIHTHHSGLWKKFMNIKPTIPDDYLFGTTEMASSLFKLINDFYPTEKAFVMAGHLDGIVCVGNSLSDVYSELIRLIRY